MEKIRIYLLNILLKSTEEIKEKNSDLKLQAEIAQLRARLATQPLTRGELTMKQLGSYLPNFKGIASQTDDFRRNLGRLCYQISQSSEWQYLMTNLKQDQVNTYIFTDEERKSEDFMRGSINGIYIVDEQVNGFAQGYAKLVEKNTKNV